MRNVVRMREAFLFLVDDEVDRALRPARHSLGFMARNGAEPKASKKLPELRGSMIIDGKFDEFHAATLRPRRQLRNVVAGKPCFFPQLIHQIDERALAVDG